MEDYLVIYTDGSSAPNPRRGGVGFRMIFPGGRFKDFSPYGYSGATNNEMELQACILALKEVLKLRDLEGASGIVLCSDSQYVVNHHKDAMFTWPKQKWTRYGGEPVLNTSQWKELVRLMKRIWNQFHVYVTFEKVKAHSGGRDNEAVDKLAKRSRKSTSTGKRISISKVRRSMTEKKTIRGSIVGKGQRIRIRIVSASWLTDHKLYRARCEVISKKSEYFGNMDFVFSGNVLNAGHTYEVVLMDGLDYCRIERIIKEVKKPDKISPPGEHKIFGIIPT